MENLSPVILAGAEVFSAISHGILLAESEERFRLIVETIDDAFWMAYVPIERMYYISPAYERIWGRTTKSLYENPHSFIEAIHPDDRERVLFNLEAQKTGQTFESEYRVIRPDGAIRWVWDRGFPVSDKTDQVARYAGIAKDITERKQREKAQRISAQKYQLLFESSHDAMMTLTLPSWKFTCANQAAVQLFGASSIAEFIMRMPWEYSPERQPDGRFSSEKVREINATILREGYHRFEWEHQRLDGHHFIAEVLANCMEIENEVFLQATVRDISKRKQIDAELRIAATAFESMEGMLVTDATGVILRVNSAFTKATGYTAEEAAGQTPRLLKSGRHDADFYAAMWQNITDNGSWEGEIWNRRKNGEIFPEYLTVTAVKNSTGAITNHVATLRDITASKEAAEEIKHLAFYDPLTNLPNRRLLLDRFSQSLQVSARSNHYGAMLFIDMDRFKTINDTLGHDCGDLLLVEVTRRILACVREVDTVARMGGDEFVVLIEEISASTEDTVNITAQIAEKIRATLAAPYLLNDHELHSSPSIGVNLYRGNEESVDTLLKRADMAMYQAKDSGRNAVRFFDYAMQLAVEAHAAIEEELRHAITDKQLRLYYQIQLDNDHRPVGAEALVRWMHPVRGMISPAQFIPIAEESSLILDVGHWVLETACRQLAAWGRHEQTQHLELAVNVSAQQFRLPTFVDTVASMVHIHHINPKRLKLELTESVVLSDVADVISKMHALRTLGIKLSLDDFGTGYSSLSYLKQLPLDQIKIDQSFVRDFATDPSDAVMAQTIISLAQNFRLHVIAEGVETDAQHAFLKKNGCMAYQGYLFSKPVPIEEFEALLKLG